MDDWERGFLLVYTAYTILAIAMLMYVGRNRPTATAPDGHRDRASRTTLLDVPEDGDAGR